MTKRKAVLLALLEAGKGGAPGQRRWPKGTPYHKSGPGPGRFAPSPGGTKRDLERNAKVAAAGLAAVRSTGGTPDEIRRAEEYAVATQRALSERLGENAERRKGLRRARTERQEAEATAMAAATRSQIPGAPGSQRAKLEATARDLEDIARIAALNTMDDPNIQRQVGRALMKGEARKAFKALAGYTVGGMVSVVAGRALMRAVGEDPTKGRSVVRVALGLGRKGVQKGVDVLATPEGRIVVAGMAILGATAVVREFLPGARRQRDHGMLIKYDRNSRIEWQKHQAIFAKDGSEAKPGQTVFIGHTRRPATYLGAEWRPQGANPTTTGRLIVQQGKRAPKAISYGSIKTVGRVEQMGSAEAMRRAREASEKTWMPPVMTGRRAFAKHLGKKLEPRLRHEMTAEIRGLRQGASPGEAAIAYGLERGKSQIFSKELRRKRRRHSRPNARRRNAVMRVAAGRPRPGDRELIKGTGGQVEVTWKK